MESLLIVYDLDNPKRRVVDYAQPQVSPEDAAEWARFIAEKHGMRRYGYILYHKAHGEEHR